MGDLRFSEGELCLLCAETVSRTRVNDGQEIVTAPVTDWRVMSRGCPRCRFLKYVEFTPTCWLWTGSSYMQFGERTYGQFYLQGQRMGAHKASYLMHVGPIADGLDCMHSCNVKACVNPAHLSPGTRTQNLLDGFAANPGVCAGENNGRARLTWDQVHAIRAARANGTSQPDLARQYGVSQAQISQIERGKRWPESSCPAHSVEVAA